MLNTTTALAVQPEAEQDIMSSTPSEREARGQALAEKFRTGLGGAFVKFLGEHKDEIIEVRKDFLLKPKTELICGCRTWEDYCTNFLGYHPRHVRRIVEGNNPALSDAENKLSRERKEKRELTARVNRERKALPIRKKTNAEVLAEARVEQEEASKVDVLQKRVESLKRELEAATATKPTISPAQERDLTKIHAVEVQTLEAAVQKSTGSIETLTAAYETLRQEAVALAKAVSKAKVPAGLTARAAKFLEEYGEKGTQGE